MNALGLAASTKIRLQRRPSASPRRASLHPRGLDVETKLCPGCGQPFGRGGLESRRWRLRRYCTQVCYRSRPSAPFWTLVEKSNDCWLWMGRLDSQGYGRAGGVSTIAHRKAWILLRGPIPKGLELDHLCRNRACVNPTHLEPVTPSENARRAQAARTSCRNGHFRTTRSTYVDPAGSRQCRICNAAAVRRYKQRRRARRAP